MNWFCHTSTRILHRCTCVPHLEPPSHLPPYPILLGHPSAPALSMLYHASNLDWRAFWVESIFAKSRVSTHERILRCTKYGLWTRQMKMIGQRKLGRNAPWKQFKPPQVRAQRLSLRVSPCVYSHVLFFFLLINTLLASVKKKKKNGEIFTSIIHMTTLCHYKKFFQRKLCYEKC